MLVPPLIEPYGIEIKLMQLFEKVGEPLIEPYGIEIMELK